jgi:TolB protein
VTTGTITPTVTLTTSTPLTSTAQVQILSPALNVRQGPGINYPSLAAVLEGQTFDVAGVDATGYWLQIRMADGQLGWISGHPPYAQLITGNLADIPVISGPALPASPPAAAPVPGSQGANPAPQGSSTGGRLVFMTGSGGDLYVINADGTNLRHLASGVIDPAVSPDGQQVAFTRWDGAEMGTLYTINLDGTNERAVVGDILQPKSPVWSPDGQRIVISFQYGGLRDPNRTCRTFGPGDEFDIPEDSTILWVGTRPDGSIRVCFIRKEDLQWRLRRVDVATGAFEDLPSDDYAYNPTWDPNSAWRIIYSGKSGLIQMDVTNGSQWPVTTDIRDKDPVFSPDGQKLAITYKQHDHWEVYTYDLATGARQRLTKPPILADPQYNSAAPTWSPDGSQIAFLTDRTGQWEIWVMNADGSSQRPMFPPEVQAQIKVNYFGVNERVLNWVN